MVTIAAPRVVTPGGLLHDGVVEVVDGRITGVRPLSAAGADVVLDSGVLLPGLVDLQVNGCFGTDFVDASERQWDELTTALPATGVTSLLPTFITAPVPHLAAALRRTAALLPRLPARPRARVLGVHVEGPFLAANRRGAHDPAHLCDPEPAAVEALLEAGGDLLALVTLAPERPGGLDAVRRLASAGVLVSLGHTDATAEQVEAAAGAGARKVTHLFNAQRPLHHREPGVVGQALADERLTLGLILDLHHVAAASCRVAFAAAPGRIALVTDAAAPAGMPPGRYRLGGEAVILEDGRPPLREDGTLAGSVLRLDEAVANAVGIGVDLVTAVDAATRVPADLIGRPDLGRIAPGAVADLVWMDDGLRTRATWVGGEPAFAAQPVTS
ncbi:N-acetylglucosamine-6-phosphate deacetylase [Kineococcus xinjiangensis]|uniref:N-acetylglucosamine-6-phosphate deacetylase n=1 Tax=Kineococcus xinjiangensis TaxID=512762 RepID=A0A2S6IVA3_9ACTN|nr:N-acetylglucosamine-6-phosphate deacetylase [Kineococcus xinjiangensis]PPK98166.1 N-acetylglucosamine-6-phosphate deacetylase [Kineococcus xinjiangensis]